MSWGLKKARDGLGVKTETPATLGAHPRGAQGESRPHELGPLALWLSGGRWGMGILGWGLRLGGDHGDRNMTLVMRLAVIYQGSGTGRMTLVMGL